MAALLRRGSRWSCSCACALACRLRRVNARSLAYACRSRVSAASRSGRASCRSRFVARRARRAVARRCGSVPWLLLVAVSLRDDVQERGDRSRGFCVHALAAVVVCGRARAWRAARVRWRGVVLVGARRARGRSISTTSWTAATGLPPLMTIVGFAAYGMRAVCARRVADAAAWRSPRRRCRVLAVNRPPARMFLGDVGAVPLGFLAAAFGIGGIAGGAWPAWFPRARLPSLRRRCDGDARAARDRAASASGKSHQIALLPAAASARRGARRNARRLRRADGGHRGDRAWLRMSWRPTGDLPRWRRGAWCMRVLFAGD